MRLIRSIVAALIIVAATPAFAQENRVGRPVPSQSQGYYAGYGYHYSYGYGIRYPGVYGRFMYRRPVYGFPLVRPRAWLIADDIVPAGRPLGFSSNAFGYDSMSYQRPEVGWNGWPYTRGNRDEEIKVPPAPSAEADTE